MRKMIVVLAAAALFVSPAFAKSNSSNDKMKACAANWSAMSADQKKATTYKKYSADCLSGKTAMSSPMSSSMSSPMKSAMTPQQRMSACAGQWQKMKADGKTGGQTYKQFTAGCTKKN